MQQPCSVGTKSSFLALCDGGYGAVFAPWPSIKANWHSFKTEEYRIYQFVEKLFPTTSFRPERGISP